MSSEIGITGFGSLHSRSTGEGYIILRTDNDPSYVVNHCMPHVIHKTYNIANDEKKRLQHCHPSYDFRLLYVKPGETILERVDEWVRYYTCASTYNMAANPFGGKYIKAWNLKRKLMEKAKTTISVQQADYDRALKIHKAKYARNPNKHHSTPILKVDFAEAEARIGALTDDRLDALTYSFPPMTAGQWFTVHGPTAHNCEFSVDNTVSGRRTAECSANIDGESKMAAIKVTNPTFVNGLEQSNYTIDQLIGMIASSKKAVKALKDTDVKSTTIDKLIAREEAGVAAVLKVLDKREVK